MDYKIPVALVLAVLMGACQENLPAQEPAGAGDLAASSEPAEVQEEAATAEQPAVNPMQDQDPLHPEVDDQAAAGTSLCADNESVIFSCRIGNSADIASLCASKGDAGTAYVYYAYGTPERTEWTFPADREQQSGGLFRRAQLGFAGGTGGYAYSFDKEGDKYIIYSISGDAGLEDQGIMVTQGDTRKRRLAKKCQQGSVVEDSDSALLKLTMGWDRDLQLEAHGLPLSE